MGVLVVAVMVALALLMVLETHQLHHQAKETMVELRLVKQITTVVVVAAVLVLVVAAVLAAVVLVQPVIRLLAQLIQVVVAVGDIVLDLLLAAVALSSSVMLLPTIAALELQLVHHQLQHQVYIQSSPLIPAVQLHLEYKYGTLCTG